MSVAENTIVSTTNLPGVVQPPTGMAFVPKSYELRPAVEDGGFVHFLRYILIATVLSALSAFLVGVIWYMIMLSSTGRRKRDVLMAFIPIWGVVVSIQTVWRYTAKNVYWSVRSDRTSSSLFAR
jgi:hypothetical protein